MRLTDIVVRNLPAPPKGQKDYRDDSLPGFMCRVSQGGAKSFVLLHGTARQRVTIGRYPIISLQEARTEAKRLLAERTLGKLQPKRISFGEALDAFVATRKEKNRPSTAYETERLLRVNFAALHKKQLSEVRAHHVTEITDALVRSGTRSLAVHAFNAAQTFLRFCAQRHYIDANPIAATEKPTNNRPRERVLTDAELRAVWKAADATPGSFGIIIKLLVLTGQRRGEVASLRAEYVGGEKRFTRLAHNQETVGSTPTLETEWTITLPAAITKNKRQHTIPIGRYAASVLQSVRPSTASDTQTIAFLFPARGGSGNSFNGWSKGKAQLDKKLEAIISSPNDGSTERQKSPPIQPWTLHDLRRTYATNLQRLGIRLEVIEALLNHVSGTRAGIVGVYNRHRYEAEMRAAVETYEAWFQETILQVEEL